MTQILSLSYSLFSLHLMKLRQIEKWTKGPQINNMFVFLVPANRKRNLHSKLANLLSSYAFVIFTVSPPVATFNITNHKDTIGYMSERRWWMYFSQLFQTWPVMPMFLGNLFEAWKLSGSSSISSLSSSYTRSND